MAQTSYSLSITGQYAGDLADTGDAILRTARNSLSTTVPVGVMVAAGSTDGDFRACAATRAFLGVVVNDQTTESSGSGVLAYEKANICSKGVIWVTTEETVSPTTAVRVRLTATGGEVVGAFRATADSTDCALVPNARWLTTTSGAGTAQLELNFPGTASAMVITADS
mgnify:CR=1 FL=1